MARQSAFEGGGEGQVCVCSQRMREGVCVEGESQEAYEWTLPVLIGCRRWMVVAYIILIVVSLLLANCLLFRRPWSVHVRLFSCLFVSVSECFWYCPTIFRMLKK